MKDTLKTIQTISRIAEIVCKVIMIFCIVGACVFILSIGMVAVGFKTALALGGINLKGIIQDTAGLTSIQLYTSLALCALSAAGTAVVASYASTYFRNEQAARTPFTLDGAKELMRLGIIAIAVSFGTDIISSVVMGIVKISSDTITISNDGVGIGIFLIAMALVLRSGTEAIEKAKAENAVAEEAPIIQEIPEVTETADE